MAKIVKIKKFILPVDGKVEAATVHRKTEKKIELPEVLATAADLKAAIAAEVKAAKGTTISSVVLKINGKEVADTDAVTKESLKEAKISYKVYCTGTPEAPAA